MPLYRELPAAAQTAYAELYELVQVTEASRSPAFVTGKVAYKTIKGSRYAYWAFKELDRSEEHTSELQSLMRISYAVFCLKKKNKDTLSTTYISQSILLKNRQSRTTYVKNNVEIHMEI